MHDLSRIQAMLGLWGDHNRGRSGPAGYPPSCIEHRSVFGWQSEAGDDEWPECVCQVEDALTAMGLAEGGAKRLRLIRLYYLHKMGVVTCTRVMGFGRDLDGFTRFRHETERRVADLMGLGVDTDQKTVV